jgi:hypothetical protein
MPNKIRICCAASAISIDEFADVQLPSEAEVAVPAVLPVNTSEVSGASV